MKNKILEALKTKFEGVNEQILGRMAEKLAKTTTREEDVQTAVDGVTFQNLLEQYGDSRANEAQQSAVTNYEKKHNLKDGKPVATPPATDPGKGGKGDGGGDDTPAWAKALIESNKAMQAELNAMKAGKITETRRGELSEILKDLPETLRKAYERTPVDSLSDDEFASLKNDIKAEVETIGKDMSSKGAVFGAPRTGANNGGGNGKSATDSEVNDVLNQLHI